MIAIITKYPSQEIIAKCSIHELYEVIRRNVDEAPTLKANIQIIQENAKRWGNFGTTLEVGMDANSNYVCMHIEIELMKS